PSTTYLEFSVKDTFNSKRRLEFII
ncbi:unnamed protein product, partial [Rotaria sordida]